MATTTTPTTTPTAKQITDVFAAAARVVAQLDTSHMDTDEIIALINFTAKTLLP